jgi:hypothetical protein
MARWPDDPIIEIAMSQLTLASIPSFVDLPDTAIAAGQALTDDSMLKISHNGKFATVRGKLIFMGFYAHGNTVPTPVDADDGYAYSRAECQYVFMPYSNRAPALGFVPGQATPPAQSASQPGPLYNWPGGWNIENTTGLVTLWTTYDQNGNEVVNNDGIIKVYAICLRQSQNAPPGAPAPAAPPAPTPGTPIPLSGPPPAPTNIAAAPGNRQVTLTWTASPGATNYVIWRCLESEGANALIEIGDCTTTSYVDTGVTNGYIYLYGLSAANSLGASGIARIIVPVPVGPGGE